MTKALTMIGLSALLALTAACTAGTPDDEQTEAQDVKVNAAAAADSKLDPKMRFEQGSCMVNDDGTEAICCNEDRCWYVNLCTPYSCR